MIDTDLGFNGLMPANIIAQLTKRQTMAIKNFQDIMDRPSWRTAQQQLDQLLEDRDEAHREQKNALKIIKEAREDLRVGQEALQEATSLLGKLMEEIEALQREISGEEI